MNQNDAINTIISLVVGTFIVPPLTSFFKDINWKDWHKHLLVISISVILGIAISWFTNTLQLDDLRATVSIVFGISLLSYRYIWQNTQINKRLEDSSPTKAIINVVSSCL